jgi:glycosyltransferase involved in cell wall biosynthesis
VEPRSLRIGLVASATEAVGQPFAGGMEAHTSTLAQSLRESGHEVVVHAAETAGAGLRPVTAAGAGLHLSAAARHDVSMPPEPFMAEHHAYLSLMIGLDELGYDVVHNNCLHYLPVAMARSLDTPMVTTLHSPPTPWLESAISASLAEGGSRWVSVSGANAAAWAHLCRPCPVIHNGVDLDLWRFSGRPRSGGAVWSGRIVPEKGTHLAIEAAARAGLPLTIAGPVADRLYFERCLALAGDDVRYAGHLDSDELAALVGDSAVALVTPCWEEPFGLVAIEALACGTPVAAFARGALPEILDRRTGALARPDSVDGLATALTVAAGLSRADCRRRAERCFSLTSMTANYVETYRSLT